MGAGAEEASVVGAALEMAVAEAFLEAEVHPEVEGLLGTGKEAPRI